MAFMVHEGYFNIGLTAGEGTSRHTELLKQLLKFGLDHFLIPNHGNSILSSYSGSVNFQEISSAQINGAFIPEILPIFVKL